MVRRFDEHIARVRKRQQMTTLQPADKVGNYVIVGTGQQLQPNALAIENKLQLAHRCTNQRSAVIVDAGHNVRRAGHMSDPVGNQGPGHLERDIEVLSPVVYARQ